ncbi:MAG: sensor histidine kinase [Clostridiales bacterium]|nr:sensor histidine kinase [Clostridiales bacterium]
MSKASFFMRAKEKSGETHRRSLLLRICMVNAALLALIGSITIFIVSNYSQYVYHQETAASQISVDTFGEYFAKRYAAVHDYRDQVYSPNTAGRSVNSTLARICSDPGIAYTPQVIDTVLDFENSICFADDAILSCIVVSDGGAVYVHSANSARHSVYHSYPYLQSEIFADFYNSNAHEFFAYTGIPEYTSIGDYEVITYACKIFNTIRPNAKNPLGMLIVNYNVGAFQDYIRQSLIQFNGEMVATLGDDVIFTTDPQYYGMRGSEIQSSLPAGNLLLSSYHEDSGVAAMGILTENTLYAKANRMRAHQIMISVSGFLLSCIFSVALYWNYHKQIKKLIAGISNANLSAKLEDANNEIGAIAQAFNHKNEQLQMWIDRHYSALLQLRDAEIKVLSAHINPHFLYNTLEGIRMRALLNDDEDSADALASLGMMFRWMLRSDENAVRIADEEEYISSYLSLQSIRFSDGYCYDLAIPRELLSFGIPKLILQPLVENAILHGSDGKRPLKISICGCCEGNDLVFTVTDNGKGMTSEELERLNASLSVHGDAPYENHIGCTNVHERLRLLFGEGYGLTITSHAGVGTIAAIRFPKMTVKAMNELCKRE